MSELAGVWLPTRHGDWYNNNPGKHWMRAKMPHTKITFDAAGNGNGWVGEFNVVLQVTAISAGQYTATSRVPAIGWVAADGNYTLLSDGVLEIRYPSNGIVEYWRREDGEGQQIYASLQRGHAKEAKAARNRAGGHGRPISLLFRHFGFGSTSDYLWHWALAIDQDVYEVGGLPMAIQTPTGVPIGPAIPIRTAVDQFHGQLALGESTYKTDTEIRDFCRQWINTHPNYDARGPNCQTFSEDLFTFLTGDNLPFAKFIDRMGKNGAEGPENDSRTVWMKPRYKPGSGQRGGLGDQSGSSACAVQ
jgi:hypothetical protein